MFARASRRPGRLPYQDSMRTGHRAVRDSAAEFLALPSIGHWQRVAAAFAAGLNIQCFSELQLRSRLVLRVRFGECR